MTKLEQLIEELCPEGVKEYRVADVADTFIGLATCVALIFSVLCGTVGRQRGRGHHKTEIYRIGIPEDFEEVRSGASSLP